MLIGRHSGLPSASASSLAPCHTTAPLPVICGHTPNLGNGGSGNSGGNGNQGGSVAAIEPLADGAWVNATANLAHKPSEYRNISFGAAKPDDALLRFDCAWKTR